VVVTGQSTLRLRLRALRAGAAGYCAVDPTQPFELDEVLQGEPVASNVTWYVLAYTRSPTVSLPYNVEAAIEALLERYQVRWRVGWRVSAGRPDGGWD